MITTMKKIEIAKITEEIEASFPVLTTAQDIME